MQASKHLAESSPAPVLQVQVPTMKHVLLASLLLFLIFLSSSEAQGTDAGPTREKGPWWPSIWGPEDQAGASNRIDMDAVLRAVRLVKFGKIYELGRVYEPSMPLNEGLSYSLTLPTTVAFGDQRVNFEFLSTFIGQVGTQLDGLGHVGTRVEMADGTTQEVFYNGFTSEEISERFGLKKLGIENAGPFLTRGVLIDVAGYKEVALLNNSYEVTVDDVRGALEKQGMSEDDIVEGDALFFRTGWAELWSDPEQYNNNPPGVGGEVARWVVERKASIVGGDTFPTEVLPGPDPNIPFIMHQELMNKNGIYNLENLTFEELVEDGVFEFFFIFTPIPFKGATGSPGRPIAVA